MEHDGWIIMWFGAHGLNVYLVPFAWIIKKWEFECMQMVFEFLQSGVSNY